MLTVEEIKGVFGLTATPSKPGADHYDATDTVDLDELERMLGRLIDDGVHGLILFGTTGEMATLLPQEWRGAAECAVQTVNKRVPLFVGATAPGTRETIERLRFAKELGFMAGTLRYR